MRVFGVVCLALFVFCTEFVLAASFGMAAVLSVIVLGDESGYEVGEVQKVKLAAIEAEWHTEPAPKI